MVSRENVLRMHTMYTVYIQYVIIGLVYSIYIRIHLQWSNENQMFTQHLNALGYMKKQRANCGEV